MKKILTIVMLCLIPLGALLLLLAQNVPGFAEGYAAAVYPVWSRGVNFVTSLCRFPWRNSWFIWRCRRPCFS